MQWNKPKISVSFKIKAQRGAELFLYKYLDF